ncbi:MAG: hypothetical protein JSS58_08870 [Proteobacteria bacterium]|nr:hypothetical protein [Pseudomonadota bacterium]
MKLSLSLVSFALLGSLLSSPAGAVGRLVDLSVIDRETGEQLRVYEHRGNYYVAGTPGNRYAVVVRNNAGSRAMTVVSVDGVNVITGETAAPGQSGYVLGAYGATEINGWRKSMEEVAAFVFDKERKSYAARTGRPENIGVIGVAVFREKLQQPIMPAPRQRLYEQDNAPAAAAESAVRGLAKDSVSRLGTGHGQREEAQASYTSFERASSAPAEIISIRYDSYRNLVNQGVIVAQRPRQPDPFPGRFVPDPG